MKLGDRSPILLSRDGLIVAYLTTPKGLLVQSKYGSHMEEPLILLPPQSRLK